MVRLDRHGYIGRELHPRVEDIGFVGLVIESYDDVEEPEMLLVQAPDGRKLELAEHEVVLVVG